MKISQIILLIKNLEDYSLLLHDVIGSFISKITDPDNFDENSEVNFLELSNKLGENSTNYMIDGATGITIKIVRTK
jgi:hypothetical protein